MQWWPCMDAALRSCLSPPAASLAALREGRHPLGVGTCMMEIMLDRRSVRRLSGARRELGRLGRGAIREVGLSLERVRAGLQRRVGLPIDTCVRMAERDTKACVHIPVTTSHEIVRLHLEGALVPCPSHRSFLWLVLQPDGSFGLPWNSAEII